MTITLPSQRAAEAGLIVVEFNAFTGELAKYRTYVEPAEYRAWCEENHCTVDDRSTFEDYILNNTAFEQIRLIEVTGTEIRGFEDDDILVTMLDPVKPQPLQRDALVTLAKDEVAKHGCKPRLADDLQRVHNLTSEDANTLWHMIRNAEVSIQP